MEQVLELLADAYEEKTRSKLQPRNKISAFRG
jgi:hypothetical protein